MVKDKGEWDARRWENRLLRSGIPRRFWETDLFGLTGDAAEKAQEYVERMSYYRERGVGLLFVGPPGTGKTTLACAVGLCAFVNKMSAAYITLAGYHAMLLEQMSLNTALQKAGRDAEGLGVVEEWELQRARIKRLQEKAQFLIVDDVGKEHATSTKHAEDSFDYLVRHRYDLGLPTIITTNKPVKEWGVTYSDSMKSFTEEAFVSVPALQVFRGRHGAR